jgi:hypothetical protein
MKGNERMNYIKKPIVIVIVVFLIIVIAYLVLRPHIKLQYYYWKYDSGNMSERVEILGHLIKHGESGLETLISIFPDGPEAAGIIIEFWDDIDKRIGDEQKILRLFHKEDGWKIISKESPPNLFHVASYHGYKEVIRILIERVVDYRLECEIELVKAGKCEDIGSTPINVASANGKKEVVLCHD